LRHVRIDRWSRGESYFHTLHAAAKLVAALTLLLCIATLSVRSLVCCAVYLMVLTVSVKAARLPVGRVLLSASAVLPFAVCFAIITALSGEPDRAAMLLIRGYLSSLTALLLISTTPMPDLLAGLEWLRAPRFLVQVMQFLYRYLLVLIEEAGAMRDAAESRAGSVRSLAVRQAAGAAGVLFVRSWGRAQAIHRAMMARGFEGHIPRFREFPLQRSDVAFTLVAAALTVGFRTVLA